jgi:hypothetical protein
MPDAKVGIPFAFLLALSATSSNARLSELGDGSELLKPGSLRTLLDQQTVGDTDEGERSNQRSPRRVSQMWFNGGFFNCFQGYWRRC